MENGKTSIHVLKVTKSCDITILTELIVGHSIPSGENWKFIQFIRLKEMSAKYARHVRCPMPDAGVDPVQGTDKKRQHSPTGCKRRCHEHQYGRFGGWDRMPRALSAEHKRHRNHREEVQEAQEDKSFRKGKKQELKKHHWRCMQSNVHGGSPKQRRTKQGFGGSPGHGLEESNGKFYRY